jgi:AcrR family transcriptional regulator
VVNAAIACLEMGGPEALSMRAVARLLETGPSSLYSHVANQNELYSLVLDKVAASVPPLREGVAGADAVEAILVGYERALSRYPGAAGIALQSAPFGEASLNLLESLLAAFVVMGVRGAEGFRAVDSLMLLVNATVAENDARSQQRASSRAMGAFYADVLASSATRRPLSEALFAQSNGLRGGDVDAADQPGVAWAVRVFLKGLEP